MYWKYQQTQKNLNWHTRVYIILYLPLIKKMDVIKFLRLFQTSLHHSCDIQVVNPCFSFASYLTTKVNMVSRCKHFSKIKSCGPICTRITNGS